MIRLKYTLVCDNLGGHSCSQARRSDSPLPVFWTTGDKRSHRFHPPVRALVFRAWGLAFPFVPQFLAELGLFERLPPHALALCGGSSLNQHFSAAVNVANCKMLNTNVQYICHEMMVVRAWNITLSSRCSVYHTARRPSTRWQYQLIFEYCMEKIPGASQYLAHHLWLRFSHKTAERKAYKVSRNQRSYGRKTVLGWLFGSSRIHGARGSVQTC